MTHFTLGELWSCVFSKESVQWIWAFKCACGVVGSVRSLLTLLRSAGYAVMSSVLFLMWVTCVFSLLNFVELARNYLFICAFRVRVLHGPPGWSAVA